MARNSVTGGIIGPIDAATAKAFWERVSIGDKQSCWSWNGRGWLDGYGRFKTKLSHRVAYYTVYGPFDYEMLVLHKCDNRSCCNPWHLFLGTNADNMRDALDKGRLFRKTDAEMIKNVASREFKWGDVTKIAKEFGVSAQTITNIRQGKYRHISDVVLPSLRNTNE